MREKIKQNRFMKTIYELKSHKNYKNKPKILNKRNDTRS